MAILFDQEGTPITTTNRLPVDSQLSGRNVEVALVTLDQTAAVAAGASSSVDVAAPTGKVGTILGAKIQCSAPSGATTGTHQFRVRAGAEVNLIFWRSNFGDSVEYNYGYIQTGTALKFPTDVAAQERALFGRKFSASQPLSIVYQNDTDVSAATRLIRLLVEYEGVTT